MTEFNIDKPVPKAVREAAILLSEAWRHLPCPNSSQLEAFEAEQAFAELNNGLIPDLNLANSKTYYMNFPALKPKLQENSTQLWKSYWRARTAANDIIRFALNAGSLQAFGLPDRATLTPIWISHRIWVDADLGRWEQNSMVNQPYEYWEVKIAPAPTQSKPQKPTIKDLSEYMIAYINDRRSAGRTYPKLIAEVYPSMMLHYQVSIRDCKAASQLLPVGYKLKRGQK